MNEFILGMITGGACVMLGMTMYEIIKQAVYLRNKLFR